MSSGVGAGRGPAAPPALAVVIPAFRAAPRLPGVLERIRRVLSATETTVIVVDDGSDDDTASLAACAGAVVLRHPENRGKGRALATGLAAAVAGGAGIIVTMDADGQHPPEAIGTLVEVVASGRADLVVGARARDGRMPAGRQLSNWLSSTLVSRAVGFRIPDSQSGFRAMRRDVAAAVHPRGDGYEYETEFLLLAARAGFRIGAVAVPTLYDGAPSHFRYGADTLAVASVFVRHWRGVLLGPEPGTPEG